MNDNTKHKPINHTNTMMIPIPPTLMFTFVLLKSYPMDQGVPRHRMPLAKLTPDVISA